MRTFALLAFSSLVLLLNYAGPASAAVVMQYVGQNNPVTESPAWTLFQGAQAGTTSSSPGNDGGVDYWDVVTSGRSRRYIGDNAAVTTALSNPLGWTMTAQVKTISASNSVFHSYFAVSDGQDQWTLTFADGTGTDTAGLYTWNGTNTVKINSAVINPASAYHTYEMQYDPTGDGGNGSVDVLVNNTLVTTLLRSQMANTTNTNIAWGNATSNTSSNARWANVVFATIDPPPAPEPASLSLLGIGLLVLVRRRDRV